MGILLDGNQAFTFHPLGAHVINAAIDVATTLTSPAAATKLLIQAEGQNVRLTLDGSDPAADFGFLIAVGDPPFIIPMGDAMVVRVIETAVGGILQYQWGR